MQMSLQYIAYAVYAIIVGMFLIIASMGIYHMHRFGADWDRTKYITFLFVVLSLILIGYSLILMGHISWDQLA